ncbi:MAG: tRNA uridine-5-carboxymethylaminomethyl(34) synthesis GTPase MnmE [Candidatus Cryptobacteroides sp.]
MFISKNDDTICAPATIPGTGAISIIRVSGPEAIDAADRIVRCRHGRLADAQGNTVRFGTVATSDDEPVDEVLVSVFRAPHSYTGEDSVEISCHASSYIVSQIIELLRECGVRSAEPGEFTQRAYLNGKMDLAQAEAVADVIASQNAASHRIAFRQMKGGFSSELSAMRASLLEIVSLMELELDFSEEDVEFADRGRLRSLLDGTVEHISRLIDSFKAGNAIKNGVPVAIAGATNTGKSTLLNALLGEDRAIVSDIHGTTRDTIEETLNIDGILFRFIDTAGIRETDETVERIGIERTIRKVSEASVVLAMLDITRSPEENAESLEKILCQIDKSEQKLMILLNKTDSADDNTFVITKNYIVSLIENKHINSKQETNHIPKAHPIGNQAENISGILILPVSAKSGDGIPALKAALASSRKDLLGDTEATLVTNTRHIDALTAARTSLLRVRSGLDTSLPTDLLTQDIRESLHHLGTITGDITTDEVLGNIFGKFCIGK